MASAMEIIIIIGIIMCLQLHESAGSQPVQFYFSSDCTSPGGLYNKFPMASFQVSRA